MSASPDRPRPAARPVGARRSFAAGRAIAALMIREMSSRYGRSPGGYVWALLEPIGGILVLSVGFSLLLRSPPIGNSFILFFATGLLPFQLYQTLSNMVARSIRFSRALLMYPAVTWADAVLARFLLNMLTGFLVMVLVFALLLTVLDTHVALDATMILRGAALAVLVGGGIGVLNCAIMGLLPIWEQIWAIATRPLFIISGVLFLYDDMPRFAQDILWWNPLIHVTGMMRAGFYPNYNGAYLSAVYPAAVGLATLFFGVLLMSRYHREILNGN